MLRPLADHHGELRLVVHLAGHARDNDGLAGADDRVGRFAEERRIFGRLGLADAHVVEVVVPQADDLAGAGDRREQGDVGAGHEAGSIRRCERLARRRERGFADLQKLDQIGGQIGPRPAEIQDVLLPVECEQRAQPAAVALGKGDELHCSDL